jgi:RND family efflux transporter MFP subunit
VIALMGVAIVATSTVLLSKHGTSTIAPTSARSLSDHAPQVPVVAVTRSDLENTLTLAADFRPFQEINVYAKIMGYVRQIKVDVGDRVKAGDVIAVLEIPEIEADLRRATAAVEHARQDVVRSKAAYDEAHLSYTRISEVLKVQPNLVAQQEIDQARSRDEGSAASLAAARAAVDEALSNQSRFKDMIGYARITAPFAGVVTKRYADTGSLVGAGTSSGSQQLIQLSQLDPLRLVLPVPESAVSGIHVGDPIEIVVQSSKQHLSAVVSRISGKVATETRTMRIEVDVPNPKLTLAPGMYASATLIRESHKNVLTLPIEAVQDRKEGTAKVLVLNEQHRIEERAIGVGMETPTQLEIRSGLTERELVVVGGQGRFLSGQSGEPKLVPPTTAAR